MAMVTLLAASPPLSGCEPRRDRRHAQGDREPWDTEDVRFVAAADSSAADLIREAARALGRGDSLTFVHRLAEVIDQPLSDTLLFAVGGLVGLSYRTVQVTHNVVADYAPRFFPDGQRIVYFSRLEREQLDDAGLRSVRYQTQVCTIDIDGGNPTVVSDGRASEFFPDVSSDGRHVVCQRAEGDTLKGEWDAATGSVLYLYDLQAGPGRRLGDEQLTARCPRFMPHRDEVVFVTSQRGVTGLLSSIDIATAKITRRYRNPLLDKLGDPFFPFLPTPFFDGTHIAFQAGLWWEKAVFVSDSLGDTVIRLTPENYSERHPSPALDNRTIVFASDGRDGEELFVRHLDDTIRQQITFDGYDKAFPAYSPDGRFVAFGAKPRGLVEIEYELYLLDLSRPARRPEIEARVKDLARKLGIGD